MNPETMSFIFGGLLILIAVLGGGFEVKELKIPKVGAFPRVIAIILGSIFVGIGLNIKSQNNTTHVASSQAPVAPAVSAPAPAPAPAPARAPAPVLAESTHEPIDDRNRVETNSITANRPPAISQSISIEGRWQSNEGSYYLVQQRGNYVLIQQYNPLYNTTVAVAEGNIIGREIDVSYVTASGTTGRTRFSVSADGRTMLGQYADYSTGMRGTLTLYR